MGVQVIWDDSARTIIRQIYTGDIVVEDYYRAVDEFVKLAESVDHIVHSIMDRTHVTSSSTSLVQALRYGNRKIPSHVGLRIIVKPTLMTRIFVDIGRRIAPNLVQKVHYVETLEEAYALIGREKAYST